MSSSGEKVRRKYERSPDEHELVSLPISLRNLKIKLIQTDLKTIDRRRFLSAIAGGAVVLVTGCISSEPVDREDLNGPEIVLYDYFDYIVEGEQERAAELFHERSLVRTEEVVEKEYDVELYHISEVDAEAVKERDDVEDYEVKGLIIQIEDKLEPDDYTFVEYEAEGEEESSEGVAIMIKNGEWTIFSDFWADAP